MNLSLIIYAGMITFLTRFVMIALLKKDTLSKKSKLILSYVPSAIFPAIIFPAIFLDKNGFFILESNPKIVAALIAIIIGYFTKNIIATIFSGLFSYWVLIFLIEYWYLVNKVYSAFKGCPNRLRLNPNNLSGNSERESNG